MDPKIRCWFLRNALDVLEHLNDGWSSERITAAVPKRLSPWLAPERLRAASLLDTVALSDAEDILFALDAAVAHGAGSSMEAVAEQLVSRALADGTASVSAGDLAGTMLRLRPLFESPFVDADVSFELSRQANGFELTVGLRGRPRAARLLRHYAVGTVRAAARAVGDNGQGEPRITSESCADQAIIGVQLVAESSQPPVSRPRSKPSGRFVGASLELEVQRILDGRQSSSQEIRRREHPASTPVRARGGRR